MSSPSAMFGKSSVRLLILCLGLLCGLGLEAKEATAHTEQEEASLVEIVPRRDYLMLRVTGAALDLRDAVSQQEGGTAHSTKNNSLVVFDRLAAHYIESQVFFEQNEQVLPVKAGAVRFWSWNGTDPGSEHFEIYARVARPLSVAKTPLSVSSTLFSYLANASTIVSLGGQTKIIRGNIKNVQFPLAATISTSQGDWINFAWNGLLHPLNGIEHALFLVTLFLAASALPLRRLLVAMVGFVLAHSVAFALALAGVLNLPSSITGAGATLSIVLCGAFAWWLSRQSDGGEARGGALLVGLAVLGGFLHGFSGAAPLLIWGKPESGIVLCVLAWTMGVAIMQATMTLVLWPTMSYWRHKFSHNAQYGGMTWSRALQIASLACIFGAGLWFVQSDFASNDAASSARLGTLE